MKKYVVVKLNEDGTKTALTKPGPYDPAKRSLVRFRNIGIKPIEIAENNAKGKLVTS
jgi:hypothetical protein